MNNVTIYTDGACSGNPGPGGWGAILMFEENYKEISGNEKETTNNKMELQAVIEALKLVKYPCDIEIYSDKCDGSTGYDYRRIETKGTRYTFADDFPTEPVFSGRKEHLCKPFLYCW